MEKLEFEQNISIKKQNPWFHLAMPIIVAVPVFQINMGLSIGIFAVALVAAFVLYKYQQVHEHTYVDACLEFKNGFLFYRVNSDTQWHIAFNRLLEAKQQSAYGGALNETFVLTNDDDSYCLNTLLTDQNLNSLNSGIEEAIKSLPLVNNGNAQ